MANTMNLSAPGQGAGLEDWLAYIGKLHEKRLQAAAVRAPLGADRQNDGLVALGNGGLVVVVGHHRDVGHGLHSVYSL